MYTPVNPSFTIYKWGLRGSTLYRHVFVKLCILALYDLKICMWIWGYPAIIFFQLFAIFQLSFCSCDMMAWIAWGRNSSYRVIQTFWNFAGVFVMVWRCACTFGLSSHHFYRLFLLFQLSFSSAISIRIDTLWGQLILQFSTHHF